MCVSVPVLVCVFFFYYYYFLSTSQHLAFQRLKLSDGEELAKAGPAGPAGIPAVKLGSVWLVGGGDAVMRGIIKQSHSRHSAAISGHCFIGTNQTNTYGVKNVFLS